jgi:hypothetical protein
MSLTSEDKIFIAGAITGAVDAAKKETADAIAAAKNDTIEAMREMQTEILRGIEAFARGNFARMHRLETSDAATVEQLAALEERVLRLETRQRPDAA